MKHITIDSPEMLEITKAAWGKLSETPTIRKPDTLFPLRLMKGTTCYLVPHLSLPRAYKYHKEVGTITYIHNGNDWFFHSADRVNCCVGSSVGGCAYYFPAAHADEITGIILKRLNIMFTK
jgi:hypothetical protein